MASEASQQHTHRTCVVYDPQSGKIHHVHYVAVLPGAKSPTKQEIEERALAHAEKTSAYFSSQLAHFSSQLKVLHVPPQSLKPRSKHRVSLDDLTIVSEQRS